MLVRFATIASLALLCACGSNDSPTPASAKSSSSTSKTSETAKSSDASKYGDSSKSNEVAKSSEPSKVTPAPSKTVVPDTTKPAATSSSTTTSSTTTSSTTTTPSSTTPSSTTPSSTTPSSTKPSSTTPSSTTPSSTTTTSTTSTTTTTKPASTPTASAPAKTVPPPMPDSDNAPGVISGSSAVAGGAADAKLVERAVAHLMPAGNSQVMGTITFRKQATGLEIHVVLDGLKPGDHGLHVHEKGDCSSMDAMSAGDHFNPGNQPHGGRESAQRHAGDFGNVTADAAGHVDVTFTDTHVALSGDTSILGRAIVVHADKDDGMTQPAGNSGERIACGVIEEDKGSSAGG